MSNPAPSELWKMTPDEFNNWRRENDLKILFESFQETLPYFDDWLLENNLTIKFILETDMPGNFFYWDKETYCVKTTKKEYIYYFFVPIFNRRHEKQIQKTKDKSYEGEISEYFKFSPYLLWVRKKHKILRPIKSKYTGDLETFRYIECTAPDVPEICSEKIAPGITVLKMGGTKIEGWFKLYKRNLDFTNLDFLIVEGKDHWNREIQIFYSSCQNLTLDTIDVNFTKFYNCSFKNLKVNNSRLYWFELYQCDIFSAYFENSSISNMIINDCSSNNFSFNRVEVENIIYVPINKEYHSKRVRTYSTISDNYKRFRIVYQANGLRKESSEAYYFERFFELKNCISSIDFLESLSFIKRKHFIRALFSLKSNIKIVAKSITNSISYLIWGFGEKPLRILTTAMIVILTFSAIYYFSDLIKLNHDFINSIYLSIVTFTTLGFGDITPIDSDKYKLIVSSEALLGVFLMGLLIAGYANKSKY